MLKRLLIITGVALFVSTTANAQIVLPPLNAQYTSYSGAAAGWRTSTMVAGQLFDTRGTVEDNFGEVGQMDTGSNLPNVTAAYKGEGLVLEGAIAVGNDRLIYRDLPAVNDLEDSVDISRVNARAAYRFGDSFSIGMSYHNTDITRIKTIILDAGGETEQPTMGQNEAMMAGSVSARMLSIFYIGGYLGNVVSAPKDNRVGNTWMESGGGIGMLVGSPGGFQLRMEYDLTTASYSFKPPAGGKDANLHNIMNSTLMSIDAKYGRALLSYSSRATAFTAGTTPLQNTDSEICAAWIPEDGLTFSLSQISVQRQEIDGTNLVTGFGDGYKLSVGWIF